MIEISNFSFQYREGATPVVQGIDLAIPDGAFVGITGAAGSGKSTLTYALNGIIPHCYPGDFYGSVVVDGLDTCDVALTDVSRLVGSVCQDVDSQFVTSVVEDEMLYGLENFGVPRDEIEGRLEQALDDMGIADLRDRTITSLSGGQKQRLCIARTLLKHPKVLIFDDSTSAVDTATESGIRHALAGLGSVTKLIIAQRITSVQSADLIVILDDGRLHAVGTHDELLAKDTIYQEIYHSQMKGGDADGEAIRR